MRHPGDITAPPSPDFLYISHHFEWPETPDIFSTGSVGILRSNKILSFFSKFQAFVFKKNPQTKPSGFHMPFSRIIYVLSVAVSLKSPNGTDGSADLCCAWIAGLPVFLTSFMIFASFSTILFILLFISVPRMHTELPLLPS